MRCVRVRKLYMTDIKTRDKKTSVGCNKKPSTDPFAAYLMLEQMKHAARQRLGDDKWAILCKHLRLSSTETLRTFNKTNAYEFIVLGVA